MEFKDYRVKHRILAFLVAPFWLLKHENDSFFGLGGSIKYLLFPGFAYFLVSVALIVFAKLMGLSDLLLIPFTLLLALAFVSVLFGVVLIISNWAIYISIVCVNLIRYGRRRKVKNWVRRPTSNSYNDVIDEMLNCRVLETRYSKKAVQNLTNLEYFKIVHQELLEDMDPEDRKMLVKYLKSEGEHNSAMDKFISSFATGGFVVLVFQKFPKWIKLLKAFLMFAYSSLCNFFHGNTVNTNIIAFYAAVLLIVDVSWLIRRYSRDRLSSQQRTKLIALLED